MSSKQVATEPIKGEVNGIDDYYNPGGVIGRSPDGIKEMWSQQISKCVTGGFSGRYEVIEDVNEARRKCTDDVAFQIWINLAMNEALFFDAIEKISRFEKLLPHWERVSYLGLGDHPFMHEAIDQLNPDSDSSVIDMIFNHPVAKENMNNRYYLDGYFYTPFKRAVKCRKKKTYKKFSSGSQNIGSKPCTQENFNCVLKSIRLS